MKNQFLDLGKQPIANNFLPVTIGGEDQHEEEQFFNISVGYDDDSGLVSLMEYVDKKILFNENYAYKSSMSTTMQNHFNHVALSLKMQFDPNIVLEIGSNDGVFMTNFSMTPRDAMHCISVEPCSNFAEITRSKGYTTYDKFWDIDMAKEIVQNHGQIDLVYSANCMCHIPELRDAFKAVYEVLKPEGVFVFEDPSLSGMIEKNSYDQIYDEHAHIFSVMALTELLSDCGFVIFKVDCVGTHGGSNRIYAAKNRKLLSASANDRVVTTSVSEALDKEYGLKLDKFETYCEFADRVQKSKKDLVDLLSSLKNDGNKIIGYGATSKSTIVFNYCGIDDGILDYISDTTESKQNMISPGMHIPIIAPPENGIADDVDYAFLGAWNYEEEILKKESAFVDRGGKFVTHVPDVRII